MSLRGARILKMVLEPELHSVSVHAVTDVVQAKVIAEVSQLNTVQLGCSNLSTWMNQEKCDPDINRPGTSSENFDTENISDIIDKPSTPRENVDDALSSDLDSEQEKLSNTLAFIFDDSDCSVKYKDYVPESDKSSSDEGKLLANLLGYRYNSLNSQSCQMYKTQSAKSKYKDFLDLEQLAKLLMKNRNKNTNGETVNWLKIKCFRYLKCKPGILQYRYDHTSDYLEINVSGKGRPIKLNDVIIKNAYSKVHPISTQKKQDLLKLCKSGAIPNEFHQYYKVLPTSNVVKDAIPEPAADDSDLESECGDD